MVRSIETIGQEEEPAGTGGSLHRIVDDALDAFISVLDQHTLEDMAGASQSAGGARFRRALGQDAVAAAASGRTRRGPQQSAPRGHWLTPASCNRSTRSAHEQIAKMCGVRALDMSLPAFKS